MVFGSVFNNLGRKIDNLNAQAVIPDAINLKGKAYAADFGVAMRNIGLSLDDFSLIKTSSTKLELAYKGKVTSLSGAIQAVNKSGDLIGSLRQLDIPPSIRNSAQVRSYADKLRRNFSQQAWVKNAAETRALTETGLDLRRKLKGPSPDTPGQVRSVIAQNAAFKKYVDDAVSTLNEKITSSSGRSFTVGKVAKTTFAITGVALTSAIIVNLVFKHRSSMNGCWLVDTLSNIRCKIPLLTCNGDAGDAGGCILNRCGPSKNQPCFSTTTCVEYDKSTQGPSICKKTLANVISAQGPCEGCNTYCNIDKLQLPPEYTLECVNVNFWGALIDFFGGVSSTLYDGIAKLFSGNFLLYVALVIIALILYNMFSR